MEKHANALVAHYLRFHGYTNTLSAFEQELGVRFNPNKPLDNDESLDSILADRINYLESNNSSNAVDYKDEDEVNKLDTIVHSELIKSKKIELPHWSITIPNVHQTLNLGTLSALIISSSYFNAIINDKAYNLAIFLTNTKYLFIIDLDTNQIVLSKFDVFGNGQQIKTVIGIDGTSHIVLCDMNGNIASTSLLPDNSSDTLQFILSLVTSPLKLHRRLITDFKFLSFNDALNPKLIGYFASIGWDSRITVGRVLQNIDDENSIDFEIIGDYKLFTNPTCLLILQDTKTNLPIVIVGRLDSSLLTLFTITSHNDSKLVELAKLSLNDSEFSSHSFQPMAITEISNVSSLNNDKIITVGTDHIPYMRLITVVVPSIHEIIKPEDDKEEILFSELTKLYEYNKENTESFQSNTQILRSYIFSNFNSLSPQDKYSNAILLSRPNCSGIWIPGDDGKLRGFDLRSGTVFETLDSNDGRAKSAFIGRYGLNSQFEVIAVCGAVDKKISIWKCNT